MLFHKRKKKRLKKINNTLKTLKICRNIVIILVLLLIITEIVETIDHTWITFNARGQEWGRRVQHWFSKDSYVKNSDQMTERQLNSWQIMLGRCCGTFACKEVTAKQRQHINLDDCNMI